MTASEKTGLNSDLHFCFDVGHSSIGWAVLQEQPPTSVDASSHISPADYVNLLGCGVVTFRADDCLASTRRAYRQQRRHIRSTRQRIRRMKQLLTSLGVLTPKTLDLPGCAWTWQLAARVLSGGPLLTWSELWDVLRWYAHNRGYDANRRWSNVVNEANEEDTEKEANARNLMTQHGVKSMAETFCRELGIDPLGCKKSSRLRFKGLNAAFPRPVVEAEVRRILRVHIGKLDGVTDSLEKALLDDWRAIACSELRLPKRYSGGLLFGQLVPRFDNRNISTCPITGEKVPSKNCPEFMNFRWAMQLANIGVG